MIMTEVIGTEIMSELLEENSSPQVCSIDHSSLDVTGYINAGGRGSRLKSIFDSDPDFGIAKALLEIGEPAIKLVDHHVKSMIGQAAIKNVVVGAGDLSQVAYYAENQYKDNSEVAVVNSCGFPQLGTAGDLVLAVRKEPELFGEQILIKNVDTILDINDSQFVSFHQLAKSALTIALTRKRGVPNEDAFYLDADGKVIYCEEAHFNPLDKDSIDHLISRRGSSTGAVIVSTSFIESISWEPDDGQLSLYRDVIGEALSQGAVAGYDNNDNFFIDVGTASEWIASERLNLLQNFLCYHDGIANISQEEISL